MRQPRDDFSAGISAVIISVFVVAIISSHGDSDPSSITWWDIIRGLVVFAILACCVIDLYKYRRGIK